MLRSEIETWLSKKGPYQEGIDLYKRAGGNAVLIKNFQAGHNRLMEDLLRKQLQGILQLIPAGPAAKSPVPAAGKEPAEIVRLKSEKTALMQRMSHLHGLLRNYTVVDIQGTGHALVVDFPAFRGASPNGTALQTALLLLKLEKEQQAIWAKLDYYAIHGHLPEAPAPRQTTPVIPETLPELIKRRNTVRTYISKAKSPEDRTRWTGELDLLEKKINELA